MGTAATTATPDDETADLEETKLMLPEDVKTWMLGRAIKLRKRGQPSMSRVVIDLVRREMARERGSNGE